MVNVLKDEKNKKHNSTSKESKVRSVDLESEELAIIRKIMRESGSYGTKWYVPKEVEWFKSANRPRANQK